MRTWAKTDMTRTHGWCTKGQPLLDKVPHGHWKTLTFIAGLRHDGIVVPCVLDGPINGDSFTAWVEQFLIPDLEPCAIVVIDNLGSHKGSRVRKLDTRINLIIFAFRVCGAGFGGYCPEFWLSDRVDRAVFSGLP